MLWFIGLISVAPAWICDSMVFFFGKKSDTWSVCMYFYYLNVPRDVHTRHILHFNRLHQEVKCLLTLWLKMRVRVKSTTEHTHTHTRMHTAQANITTPFRNVQLGKRTPLDKYIDLLNQRRLLFSLASTWLRHVIIFAQFRVCVLHCGPMSYHI